MALGTAANMIPVMGLAEIPTKLGLIAKRLEGDIRARGLRPGDRYLTVAEAASMFGVSPASAHRAMELLVNQNLLIRQQGRGTFVAEGVGASNMPRVKTIFILLQEDMEGVRSIKLDEIVEAIRQQFGSVNVQFTFVPPRGSVEYVNEVVGAAHRSGQLAGVVPISCGREVYRSLAEMGGPMVVLGSTYADQKQLPSVDVDYRQVGRLLAQRLVSYGHRHMGVLTTGDGRPGDHAFFDGISDVLSEAGLPHNALTVRIFPHDFEAFRAQAQELLDRRDRPTGVICGSERLVGVVAATAKALELSIPKDLELVFHWQGSSSEGDHLPYPHACPKLPFRQIAQKVAETLKRLSEGKPLETLHVLFDVELKEPVATKSDGPNDARK